MSFAGFELADVELGEITTRVRHAGWGPPLLLLHGGPEARMMWGRIPGELAHDFTVIVPDLGGDGERTAPANTVALMAHLGFPEFYVAGHDRGARIAYRLALDHPESVLRLSVLDIVPTDEMRRGEAQIRCPVQVLWGTKGAVARACDPLAAWSTQACDLRGEAIDANHVLADDKPAETLAALRRFFVDGL